MAGSESPDLLPSFLKALRTGLSPEVFRRPWIAAFSGGADSTALIDLLSRAEEKMDLPDRIALHVNHGLRGEESDREEIRARERALELGLPFVARRLDLDGDPEKGSLEERARNARYRILEGEADRRGASLVLLAHHEDDQVETVIQRLARGAGFRGLAGIPRLRPVSVRSTARVFRPLLTTSRQAIETYLAFRGMDYAKDLSNLDPRFQRNFIRCTLLPALAAVSPARAIRDELLALAIAARAIDHALTQGGHYFFAKIKRPSPALFTPFAEPDAFAEIRLDRERAAKVPDLFLHALVEHALQSLRPGAPLTRASFEKAKALITGSCEGAVPLGRNLFFEGRAKGLKLRYEARPIALNRALALPVPGSVCFQSGQVIRARITENREEAVKDVDPLREVFDADLAGTFLHVRQRSTGETFHPLGGPGKRKLKAYLIDRGVPAFLRDGLALVCREKEILWVAGIGMSDSFRVTPGTRRFLILEAEKKGKAEQPSPCRSG